MPEKTHVPPSGCDSCKSNSAPFQNDDEADKDCDSLCDLVQIKPQENETTVKLPRNCQNTEEDVNDAIRTWHSFKT